MYKPLVSIIILNFNGKYLSRDCINSILKSDYKNLEIILLDNGSIDDSYNFLKKEFKKNRKVKIIKSGKNRYIAGGDNYAAREAKGEKLIFMNNDIEVEPNFLNELIKCALKNPLNIVQPKILFYDKKNVIDQAGGKYTFYGFGLGYGHGQKDQGQYDISREIDFAFGTTLLIDKILFNNLGGFDESFKFHYEDVDLNLRSKKLGAKSLFCHKAIVYHKFSQTVRHIKNRQFIEFVVRRNRLRTVIKNFSGLKKFLRLSSLLIVYLCMVTLDILRLRLKSAATTLRAICSILPHNKASNN